MQVRLFIQRMQVTVLERCCADGMSCHVHAELRAGNKQCAKIPRRDIKACHFQLSLHKSRRVCGRLQTVNYEESRACPKVTGPMTMQERKSTWPQKDRGRIWSWLSKQHVQNTIQFAARMPHFHCDQILTRPVAFLPTVRQNPHRGPFHRGPFFVARTPKLMPLEHRHLVTLLQGQ